MNKCLIIFCVFFVSCLTMKKTINPMEEGLRNRPFKCVGNELCKELKRQYRLCRGLIVEDLARHVENSDTIIVIEEFYNNVIGYQNCYVYDVNTRNVRSYNFAWKKGTPFLSSKILEDTPLQVSNIIASLADGTLVKCLENISKERYTPAITYVITIYFKVNDRYKVEYYET